MPVSIGSNIYRKKYLYNKRPPGSKESLILGNWTMGNSDCADGRRGLWMEGHPHKVSFIPIPLYTIGYPIPPYTTIYHKVSYSYILIPYTKASYLSHNIFI